MANLNDALNLAQEALERCYWDEEKQYYEHHFPRKEEEAFVYWWHAHTVDALLDGYLRTGDGVYMERIRKELTGTWNANHQTFLHNWYDRPGASASLGCDGKRRMQRPGIYDLGRREDGLERPHGRRTGLAEKAAGL